MHHSSHIVTSSKLFTGQIPFLSSNQVLKGSRMDLGKKAFEMFLLTIHWD